MSWIGCGPSPDPTPKRHLFYASTDPERKSDDVDRLIGLVHYIKQDANNTARAIEIIASNVSGTPKETHYEPTTVDPNFISNYISARASYNHIRNETYKNGDIYFLIGNLEKDMGKKEWKRYYEIAVWLSKKRFRPILNPLAKIMDIKEAVQNEYTSAIIWSSHGMRKTGRLKDHLKRKLPFNIFRQHAGLRLKHFVLSNCHGEFTIKNYQFPPGARMHYWRGETDSNGLFKYLFSKVWDQDLKRDLGIQSLKNK